MAAKQRSLNLLFQQHDCKIMAVMSVSYIVCGLLFYYIHAPVILPIIMPVLGVFTTCGYLLEFHDVSFKIRLNEISIGILFYYPALFYHTVVEAITTSWIITWLMFVVFIDGSNDYVLCRMMKKVTDDVYDKCPEYYKSAVSDPDDSSAAKVLTALMAIFIITLLWNGICLAAIIKACQAARNRREGSSRLLPLNDDLDDLDADITVKKTTKLRWGPETTRTYYCFVIVLTFCLMKLFVHE